MKIKVLYAIIFVFVSAVMFAQTADKTEGCAPLKVTFTNPAGNPTGFWDFKDGATSIDKDPSNTFVAPGTYVVEFKTGISGTVVGTVTIKVFTKPVYTVTANPNKGCAPLNVNFSASGTAPAGVTITGYTWVYGDGGGGGGTNVNHTYAAGVYDVSVKINTSAATCDTTKVFKNFISASTPPVASIGTTPSPAVACDPPLTVKFANNSTSALPLKYNWTVPLQPQSTALTPPDQTYAVNGNYTASLTVTDTNGCARSTTTVISIGKPLSSFTLIKDTVCLGLPVSLTNTSTSGPSGSYLWTFDAGTSPGSSGAFQPSVSFTTPGTHTITLRSTSSGGACFHDTTKTIYVDNPTLTFTSTPTYACSEPKEFQFNATSSSPVQSWMWLFGDGKVSVQQNPKHTFAIPDSAYSRRGRKIFTNGLTAITTAGCISTASGNDTIHLVWAKFQPDTAQGCAPLTVTFYDSSKSNTPTEPIVSWKWNYDDGSAVNNRSSKAPHTHTFTNPGKYDVVLIATNNKGCNDTSYAITIDVGKKKNIDFTASKTSVCPGEPVTFTHNTTDTAGIRGWNYSSNGELLSHCFQDQNPTLIFNDSVGPQTITLTADYNGCLTTVTKPNMISVKGPIAHFNYLTDCANKDVVQFTDQSGDATTLSWDFGDSNTATTTGTFNHTYAATGDYRVILTATNGTSGCPASKDTAFVHVKHIQAGFNNGDTTFCVGVPYTFDASTSIDVHASCKRGYTWVFSDSTKRPYATDVSTPLFSFGAGEQNIGLIVTDINGCKDTLMQHIKVYSSPAGYTISDSIICIPDTIQFTDITVPDTTLVKWYWNFGDGGVDSVQNPIHVYNSLPASTSVLTTTLTVTDTLGCISSLTKNISIYKVSSIINATPSNKVCLGDSIRFAALDFTSQGSYLTYNWDLRDGQTFNTKSKSHTYATSGTYNVKLYYTEAATGCKDSIASSVYVQDYPVAGFSTDVDNLNALCNPQIINFTDTSKVGAYSMPITPKWYFDGSTTPLSGSTPTTVFTKGTHSVKLIATTSNGCADTVTKSFLVVGPAGDFDFDKNNICRGETITFTLKDTSDVDSYTWDFGDGSTTDDVNPIPHTYKYVPPLGKTVAKLIVFGQGGVCPVSAVKDINIRYVKADFKRNSASDLDTAICLGNTMTIIDSSKNADVYFWSFGNGETSASKGPTFVRNYTTPGTYTVTLGVKNNTFGCTDTMVREVIVNALPTVVAKGDSVCYLDTAQLLVTNFNPAYSYKWTPATNILNDSVFDPKVVGLSTQNYYVTATVNSTGCTARDTAGLFVVMPLYDYDEDTSIVIGEYVTLPINNQNGLVNFVWTPTTGLSCLACNNPTVQPLEDITYSSFMSDILGCSSATATFKIHIYPETFIKMPTTFTPNGDGFNDVIYVKGWGLKKLLSFEIYNRWGELVFSTADIEEGWDGYYKGMLQNNDTYVYKVKAQTFRNIELFEEGHINLMR